MIWPQHTFAAHAHVVVDDGRVHPTSGLGKQHRGGYDCTRLGNGQRVPGRGGTVVPNGTRVVIFFFRFFS